MTATGLVFIVLNSIQISKKADNVVVLSIEIFVYFIVIAVCLKFGAVLWWLWLFHLKLSWRGQTTYEYLKIHTELSRKYT